MTTTAPPALPPELTHCDRCGVSGSIHYRMADGLDLVFCGHHDRRFGLLLVAAGAVPVDMPG